MTISRERRKFEMQDALVQFYQDVGDRSVREVELLPEGPDYGGRWLATTWAMLAQHGQLDRWGRPVKLAYKLTTFGWYTGLKLSGGLEDVEVRSRAKKLVQSMKRRIDGRHDHDAKAVAIAEIADEAGVPRGWTSNALHSTFLLRDLFGRLTVDAQTRPDVDTVIIPPTFGQSWIQYDELSNDRSPEPRPKRPSAVEPSTRKEKGKAPKKRLER